MIAIVDYGCGNLFSLQRSFEYIGVPTVVTGDERELERADKLVLPGVGAFGDAAKKLRDTGLGAAVKRQAEAGKDLLGICLGMQLLFEKSYEYGEHEGLGLIPGEVRPIEIPAELQPEEQPYKVPQMGWNSLHLVREHPLFAHTREGEFVYFVHSYHGCGCEDALIAQTEYGIPITAAVARGHVCGTQFHPEKSGPAGLAILRAFSEL